MFVLNIMRAMSGDDLVTFDQMPKVMKRRVPTWGKLSMDEPHAMLGIPHM